MNLLRLFLIYILLTVCASSNAQTVKFIDNKGTLRNFELAVGNVAEVFDNTGGQTLNEGFFSAISFSSSGIIDSDDFSALSDGLTILNPGRYEITYRVTTKTVNNERNGGEFYLEVGAMESPGTRAYTYSRNNLTDKSTVTVIKIINVLSHTIIKVKGRVYASSQGGAVSSLQMASDGSSLVIKRIK